jgi:hypothetical protein
MKALEFVLYLVPVAPPLIVRVPQQKSEAVGAGGGWRLTLLAKAEGAGRAVACLQPARLCCCGTKGVPLLSLLGADRARPDRTDCWLHPLHEEAHDSLSYLGERSAAELRSWIAWQCIPQQQQQVVVVVGRGSVLLRTYACTTSPD